MSPNLRRNASMNYFIVETDTIDYDAWTDTTKYMTLKQTPLTMTQGLIQPRT